MNNVVIIGKYLGSWGSGSDSDGIMLEVEGQENPVLVWLWTWSSEFELKVGDMVGVKGHIEAGNHFVKVVAERLSVLRVNE